MRTGLAAVPATSVCAVRSVVTYAFESGRTPRPEASTLTVVLTPVCEASALTLTVLKRSRMDTPSATFTRTTESSATVAVA